MTGSGGTVSTSGLLLVGATLAGSIIAVLGQEFHLWREHRRRFDHARQVAYTNLISEAFRFHNAFVMAWSPLALIYGRRQYAELLDDLIRSVAAVRLLASRPVHAAAIDLMAAVEEAVEFANGILAHQARFGAAGWFLFGKPLPVARHPELGNFAAKIGKATTRFIVAAQKEMKVPRPRQKLGNL